MLLAPESTYEQHGVELVIPPQFLEETTNQIEDAFCGLESGQPLDVAPLRQTVRHMLDLVGQRPRGAIKLLDLDRFDRYTYRHSINVSLLYLLNAQTWATDEEELSEQVLGALLHDVGKVRVGSEIVNKPARLTDEEMSRMRQHPLWGLELLAGEEISPAAREIIVGHHERIDGRGYPHGRPGHELSAAARMSAICDVYDALTTSRSYKAKMNFSEAIDLIIQSAGSHFDSELAHLFITKVGRHPIGSFVKLSSGEVAVVVRLNPRSLARPIVSRALAKDGSLLAEREEFDLSQHPQIRIQHVISPAELTRAQA
jgi:putative nucleotidyltransferase with HDIG domain